VVGDEGEMRDEGDTGDVGDVGDMGDVTKDRTGDPGCEQYADDLTALALGALAGRQRARTLAHVEACPRCAEELEQMARLSDSLVQIGPEVEPPLGFETRLFERMGVTPSASAGRRRRLRRWVPAVVAAAAAAAAVGLGLSLPSSTTTPTVTAQGGSGAARLVSAPLLERGRTVGRVSIDGHGRWMSMMLFDSGARGPVDCVVVARDGSAHHVGTFVADAGYGAWIAPLRVDPAEVTAARLVSPSGAVIATATLG
jgi:Putative zinc-finger